MKILQRTTCLVFLSALAFSAHAHAGGGVSGGGVSGGGNVLECKNSDGKQTYQLLDYFENRKPGGFNFKLDLGSGTTYQEKVKYVLDRMAKVDGYRGRAYQGLANTFIEDALRSQEGSATPSDDLGGGMVLPDGCKVTRVVILRSEEQKALSGSRKKYEIVQPIWDQLDEGTKAGLVLHEIAYSEAIKKGAKSSLSIRRFVSFISSKDIETADYSFEILLAGLVTWGEKASSEDPIQTIWGGYPVVGPYRTNGPFFNNDDYRFAAIKLRIESMNGEREFILRRNGLSRSFSINIFGQKVKCKEIELSKVLKDSESMVDFLDLYKKLLSSNLDYQDLEQGTRLAMNCDPFIIESKPEMSSEFNLKIAGSYFGQKMYNSPRVYLGAFWNPGIPAGFHVIKGTLNGRDVSGKTCMPIDRNDPGHMICSDTPTPK